VGMAFPMKNRSGCIKTMTQKIKKVKSALIRKIKTFNKKH